MEQPFFLPLFTSRQFRYNRKPHNPGGLTISKSSKITSLRIGGGTLSGRKLYPPPHDGTRPMTAMAKKSIFGMVAPWVSEGVVLDLYSGTGTLGLESISYGAKEVYFAERDRRVIERLEGNIELCHCEDQCTVWTGNIESRLPHWLDAMSSKADLVFLDPPFPDARRWNFDKITESIFLPLAKHLNDDGLIVLRTDDATDVPTQFGELVMLREKQFGQMMIRLIGRESLRT